jgi:hypothetical protein
MSKSQQNNGQQHYLRGTIARNNGKAKPMLLRTDLFASCWAIAGWNDRDIELTVDHSTNS